ncbi:hypothetical protein FPV67DRAFT_1508397 [Lyophyllum atratum]|nr:hypothetical protein FPV67DRAFT_1508397 [Lyophyllum atratum]
MLRLFNHLALAVASIHGSSSSFYTRPARDASFISPRVTIPLTGLAPALASIPRHLFIRGLQSWRNGRFETVISVLKTKL